MIERIHEEVYKIVGDGNVYILLNPEVFVIDTSNPNDYFYIKNEIEKIISLGSVKKVLLTHLHYDHTGNIDLFENAEVYASKEDLDDFKKNPDLFFLDSLSETSLLKLKNAKILSKKINGLEVVKCPGHTKGSVAFLDEKRKILFSGDTLFNNGIGRTDFVNSVPEKMNDSLLKLKKLMLEKKLKLCCGHG